MGFNGYWFNTNNVTNKYPHCYVGTVGIKGVGWGCFNKITDDNYNTTWGCFNKITDDNYNTTWGCFNKITDNNYNTTWGFFNKITDDNYNTTWGFYGGDDMLVSALQFNSLGEGFVIENLWHKLSSTYYPAQASLYDGNGKLMDNPKYKINIFYKLIIPSTYVDNEDTNLVMFKKISDGPTANFNTHISTLDNLKNIIQCTPTLYDKYGEPHCLLTGDNPGGYLALPSLDELGYNDKMPVGTEITNLTDKDIWSLNEIPQIISSEWYKYVFQKCGRNIVSDVLTSTNAKFLNTSDSITSNISGMLTSVNYSNGIVNYGINTSNSVMGIPFENKSSRDSSYKALMPKLFTGFIMQNTFYIQHYYTDPVKPTLTGALYMCLGVESIL